MYDMRDHNEEFRYSQKKEEIKRRMLKSGFARIEVIEMLLEDLDENELDALL